MIASARMGKNTGPGRLRRTAMPSAKARITTSATKKILTSSQKADSTSGNQVRNSSPLRNFCLTSSQPEELTTSRPSAVNTMAVDTSATATLRPAPPPPPRIRDRRSPAVDDASVIGAGSVEDGRADDVGEPLLLDGGQRSVRLQRCDRLVDAGRQRAVLVEHERPLILAAGARELADDGAATRVDEGDVVRGREVDHQPVDLAVVQRLGGVARAVVDVRLRVRGDHAADRVGAGGADLDAQLVALQVGQARRLGD